MNSFCPNCGFKIEDSSDQFCVNCGYSLANSNNANNFNNQNYNMNNVNYNQYQGYAPQTSNYTNGWGIAGFVCSLVSLLCCGLLVFAGLPMSIVGFVDSKKHNGVGKGLSLAGIIISGVSVLITIINFLFIIFI